MHRSAVAALATLVVAGALAQSTTEESDWRDAEAPPAPALRTTGLIPLEIPGSSLKFGVDPSSIAISKDGVVRYVVVATSSSGAVNAMYEGIRCSPGVVRTFARHDPARGWVSLNGEWRPLLGGGASVRHSLEIARLGACNADAPNGPAEQIARDLGSTYDRRFRNESR